jgi:predicted acetyltransferase
LEAGAAVPVTIRDARDSADDRAWIRATYRSYLSELSVSKSGLFPALVEWPSREEEFLAGWFNDPTARPFVILADGQRAGFALVARPSSFPRRSADFRMAEFFVVDRERRRGIGAGAAKLLFTRFAGQWEVIEDEYNRPALAFWRRVIGAHCDGHYNESREAGEVCHRFDTAQRIGARPGG